VILSNSCYHFSWSNGPTHAFRIWTTRQGRKRVQRGQGETATRGEDGSDMDQWPPMEVNRKIRNPYFSKCMIVLSMDDSWMFCKQQDGNLNGKVRFWFWCVSLENVWFTNIAKGFLTTFCDHSRYSEFIGDKRSPNGLFHLVIVTCDGRQAVGFIIGFLLSMSLGDLWIYTPDN